MAATEPSPVRRAVAALDALMYAASATTAAQQSSAAAAAGDASAGVGSAESVGYLSPYLGSSTETHGLLPSDRLAYLRRLRTFRPGLWPGRPPCCDAVAAARHGWCAVGGEPDVLACCFPGCDARTALLLPASLEPSAVAAAAAAFVPKLQSAHGDQCPWKTNVTPHHIASFPPLPRPLLADAFTARVDALVQGRPHLPAVTPAGDAACGAAVREIADRLLVTMDVRASGGAPLPPAVDAAQTCAARDAVFIALCGWRLILPQSTSHPPAANGHDETGVLRCDTCGISVGLWNMPRGRPPPGSPAYAQAASSVRLQALSQAGREQRSDAVGAAATAMMYTSRGTHGVVRTIAGGSLRGSPGPFGAATPAAAFGNGTPAEPAAKRQRLGDDATSSAADVDAVAATAPHELQPKAANVPGNGASAHVEPFQPVRSHRPFCPWVNARPAAVASDVAAAMQLLCGWQRTAMAVLPQGHAAAAPPGASGSGGTDAQAGELAASQAGGAAVMTPVAARALVRTLLSGKGGAVPK